jgi:hypothetical protein
MLLDSAYHAAEGVLAGSIIGLVYRQSSSSPSMRPSRSLS